MTKGVSETGSSKRAMRMIATVGMERAMAEMPSITIYTTGTSLLNIPNASAGIKAMAKLKNIVFTVLKTAERKISERIIETKESSTSYGEGKINVFLPSDKKCHNTITAAANAAYEILRRYFFILPRSLIFHILMLHAPIWL